MDTPTPLNCAPGCQARVIVSKAGNEGKIVRVLRFLPSTFWAGEDGQSGEWLPGWIIEPRLPTTSGGTIDRIPDAHLMPVPPVGVVETMRVLSAELATLEQLIGRQINYALDGFERRYGVTPSAIAIDMAMVKRLDAVRSRWRVGKVQCRLEL